MPGTEPLVYNTYLAPVLLIINKSYFLFWNKKETAGENFCG